MALRRSVVFAALAVLAVAGCVQRAPTPLPEATPTFSCTPVAGGTPYPCYENQFQEVDAQNKLYEEAQAVYRRLNAEDERIYRAGGASEPTSIISETMTGSALEAAMANYRELAADGTKMIAGSYRIASLNPVSELRSGSVTALRACLDISDVTMKTPGHAAYRLKSDGIETAYFVREGELLKISEVTNKWVASC